MAINQKELDFIITQGEGQFIEFKENFNSNMSKEIVAFANAQGGRIFLGLSDSGKQSGIKIDNVLKSKIIDLGLNCDPKIKINLEKHENILIITVDESLHKPHSCSTGFYLRIGSNSQKLTRNEIFKFAISEGVKAFDEELCQEFIYPQDFDEIKLTNYLEESRLKTNLDTESVLLNLGVAKKIKNKLIFNNAGVLFFAKCPSQFFLTSKVVCAEYATNQKVDILDKKIYDDGILANIKQAVNFVKRRVKTTFIIEKLAREEIPQFPENAYREAVVNAIMHRDYNDKSSDVLIEFFRNKLIIHNPGGLVSWLNPEDFGKLSKTRNSIIASLLSRTIYVEKLGTGIKRIKEAMSKDNLPKPEFSDRVHYFFITLKDAVYTETVEETVEETVDIKKLIKENPRITAKKLESITGLTRRGVEWNLKKMKENGTLKRIGSTKSGYWKVVEEDRE